MQYDKRVIEHFESPKNIGTLDENDKNVGTGMIGSPACGDVMKLQIKVKKENGKEIIEDVKFKTYGCGSAIASSSLATEWIKGKTIEEALQVKDKDIARELKLPPIKIHCSVLAGQAIAAAVQDYRNKQIK
ncbi:MAG: Fe-S cluster assembly scaffold IscU [Gammaproteobacteria bacterium]|nr:Fe-S cluster assembly scaffold IscU [Gammaproteobacteria bacterium]